MTVLGVTSFRSSPGVSSLSVGLAAAFANQVGSSLVVEADPAGGVFGMRFDLPSSPSLASLSADLRRSQNPKLIVQNSVELDRVRFLTNSLDPAVAASVLSRSAEQIAARLSLLDVPTVVDLGRIARHSPAMPLAVAADVVLVVCRPRLDEIQAALFGIHQLKIAGCRPALVTVGDRPHNPTELADLADVPLAAIVPDDPVMAVAFSGGSYRRSRLKRSTLWRSMMALAEVNLPSNGSFATEETLGTPAPPQPPSLQPDATPSPTEFSWPPPTEATKASDTGAASDTGTVSVGAMAAAQSPVVERFSIR